MFTISTFSKPEEAHLFCTRLEAVDIPAYVQDEFTVQNFWWYSNAIGGVRVQIFDEDVDEALEFLSCDTEQQLPDTVDVVCPKCGSIHAAPDEVPRRIAYLLLLFGRPLLLVVGPFLLLWLLRRNWRCQDCQHTWRLQTNPFR